MNDLSGGFSQFDEVTLVRTGRDVTRTYTCLVLDGHDRVEVTRYPSRRKAMQAREAGIRSLLDAGYRPF